MAKGKVKTIFDSDEQKPSVLVKLLPAAVALLAITAIILLAVLLVNIFGKVHLVTEMGGGRLVDTGNDITYTLVSPCPYTVNLDLDEPYAESDGVKYYKIVYMDNDGKEKHYDPLKMIATVDEYRNVDLYLASGFTLPTFDQITPTHTRAYYVQVEEVAAGTLTTESTTKIVNALKQKENSVYPSDVVEDSRLNLYLIDPEYPYFWYTVEYFETESGEAYLRDRVLGKCINATVELEGVFKDTSEGEGNE